MIYKLQTKTPFKENTLKYLIFEMDLGELFKRKQDLKIFDAVLQFGLDNLELQKIKKLEEIFVKKVGNHRYKSSQFIVNTLIEIFDEFYAYDQNDTSNHFKRVSLLSGFLAEKYTDSKIFAKNMQFYSVLHDIGKLGIPDRIMEKSGKLTVDEFEVMKSHSKMGIALIKKLKLGKLCENIIAYHHERWDGKGYHGLIGESIPLEARIVSLADVYDALRGKRCYKASFTHEEAKKIIVSEKGDRFEPKLVEIFLENENEFKSIYETF